jgi:antitoxin YefM
MARILAMPTLPLATVRDRLSSLVDDVARTHDTLTITRNGIPAAVVLSVDDYESIMETLALLNDPTDRDRLAEAERSVAAGEVTDSKDMGRILAERIQRATGAA